MSYRNDPYDPKQAVLLAPEALEAAVADAEKAFAGATNLDALGALKSVHLGDRSPVSLARREIGSLPPHAKSEAGKRVNVVRQSVQGAFDARLAELQRERAVTMLYTSHNMRDIEEVCDRVLFIHAGRLLTAGTPLEVTERFRTRTLEEVFIQIARGGDVEIEGNGA